MSSIVGSVGWCGGVNGITVLGKSYQGVKVDSLGNSYTLLYTDNSSGTMRIINPNGSVATTVSVSANFANFIIKRDSNGIYLGHFYVTGSANEGIIPNAIEIDSQDSLYLIGLRFGVTTLTVGSSFVGTTTTLAKSTNDYQGYFIKWNSSGTPIFAMNPMSSRGSAPWGIRESGSNIYMVCNVGVVETTNVLNANGTTFRSISAVGSDQGLIIKYDLSGNVSWAFRCSFNNGAFRPIGIDLDSSGNIYVGGRIFANGTYTIYNLSGTNSEISSISSLTVNNAVAGFLLKYNSSGALQWRMVIDGVGTSQGNYETEQVFFMRLVGSSLYIPILSGSSAITTVLNGSQTASVSTQSQSSVLFKIGTDGTHAWAIKTTAPSTANYSLFDSIAVDENNNVYASSSFNSATCTITDSANSSTTITRKGSIADGFVAWFNSSGVYQNMNQISNVNPGDAGSPWTSARQPEINYFNGKILVNAQIATSTTIYHTDGSSSATFSRNASEAYVVSHFAILVYSVPNAPSITSTTAGNAQVSVAFSTPSNNGSAISSYTVISSPGNFTASGASSPLTITGLTNGTSYTFTVTATNGAGTSSPSSASNSVIPRTVPDAPTITSTTAGNAQVSVAFSTPSNNGSAITSYIVTSSPGNFTASGSSSPLTITGLTNGTSYTFTVTATNGAGTSSASSASSSVTPIAPSIATAISESPVSLSAFISAQPVTNDVEKVTLINDVRNSLKTASFATNEEKANAKKAYIDAMISSLGTSTYTVPSTDFTSFKNTFSSVAGGLTAKPVNVVFPTFSSQSATIDISSINTSSYTHIEVPIGYTIVLQNGATTLTLLFNGTAYINGGTTYNLGSSIIVGDKTIQLIGIGSGLFQQGNNAGGGAGDPYVTTIQNVSYKLPVMDATIRFYQGLVDNKVLTVNASLKTISSNEMIAENIHTFLKLKETLNSKQLCQFNKSMFEKHETLSFFEKFYIKYDNNEILINVWNSKFEIEKYKGSFKSSVFNDLSIISKSTNLYKNYKNETLKFEIGSANIYVSVYEAPLVRNGIYIEAPNMESGNGVLVNTLSSETMKIKSIDDTSSIERVDCKKHKIVKEYFIDNSGYREREILTFI